MHIHCTAIAFLTFALAAAIESFELAISSALLGDELLDVLPSRRISGVGANGRRLSLATPTSSFVVEPCASIAGLSAAKQSALASASITKCVNVFNVLITGHSGLTACGDGAWMLHIANTIAELLDNDRNGVVDDANVVSTMGSLNTSSPGPIMLIGCNSDQETSETTVEKLESAVAEPDNIFSGQAGPAAEEGEDVRVPLTEEAIHFTHSQGWAKAYPAFAPTWTSHLGLCTKAAQCVWYMHPQNAGCSDASGTTCSNSETACTGTCASFNTPGQCYETEHNCARANCDIVEFFNQVWQTLYQSPFFTDGQYDKVKQSGATTQAGIKTQMKLTTACTDLLNDFENTAYSIARSSLTGVYDGTTASDGTTTTILNSASIDFASTIAPNRWATAIFIVFSCFVACELGIS